MGDPANNGIFERLVAISVQPMAVIRNRRYHYVNAAFSRMFGYGAADLEAGLDMFATVPAAERPAHEKAYEALEPSSALPDFYPLTMLAKDGTPVPCDAAAQVTDDGNGGRVMLISYRERLSVETLRASERKFRTIVEASPLGMHLYELAPDGSLVFTGANPAADRILKVANNRFIGKTIEEAFPALAETEVPERYRRVARTGAAWFTEQIEYDGNDIAGAFEVYAFQTEPNRMVAAFQDITERRKHLNELHRARTAWQNIFQAIGSPTLILAPDHTIKAANTAAVTAIGLPERDILGKHCYEFFHGSGAPPAACPLGKVIDTSRYETVEMEMEALGGTYLVSCTPILDRDGNVESIIHIATNITARKKAEERLADSERTFRTLIENSVQGIILAGAGGVEYLNPALERLLGYTLDDMGGDIAAVVGMIVHPDDRAAFLENISIRLTGGEVPSRYEVRLYDRKKRLLWADVSAARVDYHGSPGLLAFITDITERKLAENALRESENRYRAIFENASVGILIADAETHRFRYANPMISRMLGYAEQDLYGMSINDIHPQDAIDAVFSIFVRQRHGELAVAQDTPCLRRDGSVFYADISAAPAMLDGRECSVGFFRDVTDRREARTALNASEAYLHSVFRAAPTGIGVVINRNLAQVNERICEMTGYTAEELRGQNTRLLYFTQDDFEAAGMQQAEGIREKGTATLETRWRRKDGTAMDVLLGSTPIDPADHDKGLAFTALDITERTGMLERLRASVHEKDILLKEVHHRVKNNLQVISSLLSLQSKYITDPRALELFTDSRHRIRSMALIHEQLYRTNDFSEIDFRDYIGSITAELGRAYGSDTRRIVLDLDIGDVRIGLNQAIPCGVIINELLSNAFKYAFPPAHRADNARITVAFDAHGPDGTYRLTVADNGIGLPEDVDFEATDSLGMHLVRLLVEDQLDGTLDLSGENGTAITITFAVPA